MFFVFVFFVLLFLFGPFWFVVFYFVILNSFSKKKMESESQKALDHLLKTTIPSFCDQLREEGGKQQGEKEEGEMVTELLHSLGVNLRYGGVVLSSFEGKPVGKAETCLSLIYLF